MLVDCIDMMIDAYEIGTSGEFSVSEMLPHGVCPRNRIGRFCKLWRGSTAYLRRPHWRTLGVGTCTL